MPESQIGIAAISNCSDVKSQSASEIATKIASESVAKRVVIRITAISNRYQVGFGHLRSKMDWGLAARDRPTQASWVSGGLH